MYVIIYGAIALFCIICVFSFSKSLVGVLAFLLACLFIALIIKRNSEIKKHNMNEYDENAIIIQNVGKGGIIRLTHMEGRVGVVDLKVVAKHLYMEGDYSWFELECVDENNEKVWVEVDDDDELQLSVMLYKPAASTVLLNYHNVRATLDTIDENEEGYATHNKIKYKYKDSGEATFYKYCDTTKKERFYYYDFDSKDYILSAEKWKSEDGREDIEYSVSQKLKPSDIIVYSIKGENK